MRELALHLLKSLADRPESVTVTEEVDGDVLVLVARAADDDKGKVIGKGGKSVQDFWAESPRAYLGTCMPGFPNLFIVTGPNTGIGHTSAIFVIEAQMEYIRRAIQAVLGKRAKAIEITPQAEADYTAMIHREMKQTVWHWGGCNSWYKSKSGHVIAMFPGFSFTFRRLAQAFKPAHHTIA